MCNLPWSLIFVKETALSDNRPNGSMLLSCSASWTYSLEKRERMEKTQNQIPIFRESNHLSIWAQVGLPFNLQSFTMVTDPRPIMQTAKMPPHLPWSYSFKFSVFILLDRRLSYTRGEMSASYSLLKLVEELELKSMRGPGSDMSLPGVIPDTVSNQTTCTHAHTQCLQCIMGPKPIWLHGVKWTNIRFWLGSCKALCNVPRSLRYVPKMEPKMEPLIMVPDTISSWTPEVLLSPKLHVCWSSSFGLCYSPVDMQLLEHYIGWQGRGCTLLWESTVKTLFSYIKPLFMGLVP